MSSLLRSKRTAAIGFGLLLTYAAILVAPFLFRSFSAGLDPSHMFGSNYFPNTEFRYGPDTVFTYGPLGYFVNPENIGNNLAIAMAVQGAAWILLIWELVALFREGGAARTRAVIFAVALVAGHNVIGGSFDYFLVTLGLLLLLRLESQPGRKVELAFLIALTGILLLVKLTAYAMMVAAIGFHALRGAGWPPRNLPKVETAMLAAAVLSGPAAYLIYNPSLTGLWLFLRGSLAVSSGYSIAMSLATPDRGFWCLMAVLASLAVTLALAVSRKSLHPVAAIEAGVLAWMAMKHGFVRADGHQVIFFAVIFVIAGCALARIELRNTWWRRVYLTLFAILSMSAAEGQRAFTNVLSIDAWSPQQGAARIRDVLQWGTTIHALEESRVAAVAEEQLAESPRKELVGKRVLVFPMELARALPGDFLLEPLYAFQAYSTYTAYLDQKSAARIRERTGVERVLFEWQNVDGRHPLLDVPETWDAMYRNYMPLVYFEGGMIAGRRPQPQTADWHELTQLELDRSEWLQVPASTHPLSATLDLQPTLPGKLRTTLYKMERVWLDIETRSGQRRRFRIIPEMLGARFPLNWLPMDLESLEQVWKDRHLEDPVQRIRLGGRGEESLRLPAMLRVFEDRTAVLDVSGSPVHSIEEVLHGRPLGSVTALSVGSLDRVNDTVPLPASVPIYLTGDQGLELAGWMGTARQGRAFDAVYAVVNGVSVQARRQIRPDVAKAFGNPAMAGSGFHVNLPPGVFKAGTQTLDFIGVLDAGEVYRFPEIHTLKFTP